MTNYSQEILYFSINMLLNYQGLVWVQLKIFFVLKNKTDQIWESLGIKQGECIWEHHAFI